MKIVDDVASNRGIIMQEAEDEVNNLFQKNRKTLVRNKCSTYKLQLKPINFHCELHFYVIQWPTHGNCSPFLIWLFDEDRPGRFEDLFFQQKRVVGMFVNKLSEQVWERKGKRIDQNQNY